MACLHPRWSHLVSTESALLVVDRPDAEGSVLEWRGAPTPQSLNLLEGSQNGGQEEAVASPPEWGRAGRRTPDTMLPTGR